MTGFSSKRAMVNLTQPVPSKKHLVKNFRVMDKAIVDGKQWYTVRTARPSVSNWLRGSNKTMWYEHPSMPFAGSVFDVHEKLFTLLSLRWP